MKLKEIISFLNSAIPTAYQEDYDNSGLQCGDPESVITGILIALDPTPEVVNEAFEKGCNLVITHHPLFFKPVRQISTSTASGKTALLALKNGTAVYSAHTSLDSATGGVSMKLAAELGLKGAKPLSPLNDRLVKLVTFVPPSHSEQVKNAIFAAGAGVIGKYDCCSFTLTGKGSFRAGEGSQPFTGKIGTLHTEEEERIETILPSYLLGAVVDAMIENHPYEEPAYDIYKLENALPVAGLGAIGELEKEMSEEDFLKHVRTVTGCHAIKHSRLTGKKVMKVALCGGAGGDLIKNAIACGADAFITGDLRYHDFTEYADRILLADAGHFETEKFSAGILYDLIIKKFPTFAVLFSEKNTNPINYL
jgi:dinuclear metal center YbgI/SA1388 family protein